MSSTNHQLIVNLCDQRWLFGSIKAPFLGHLCSASIYSPWPRSWSIVASLTTHMLVTHNCSLVSPYCRTAVPYSFWVIVANKSTSVRHCFWPQKVSLGGTGDCRVWKVGGSIPAQCYMLKCPWVRYWNQDASDVVSSGGNLCERPSRPQLSAWCASWCFDQ